MPTAIDPHGTRALTLPELEGGAPEAPTGGPRPTLGRRTGGEIPAPSGLALGTTLVLGAALLLVLTLAAVIGFASWTAHRVAEEKIRADLGSVPSVFKGWEASQAESRKSQVRSLAEDAGTKALLAEAGASAETAHDTARDFARALGAGAVFLLDARGALLSRSDRNAGEDAGRDFSKAAWVREPISALTPATAYILDGTKKTLSLAAAAPVTQGEAAEAHLNGVLAGTFPMSDERAVEVARLVSGEAAFLASFAPRGAPPVLQELSSSRRLRSAELATALAAMPGATETLLIRGTPYGPFELSISGERFVATALPLKSGGGEPIAALVVARSTQAELAAFRRIRDGSLLVGALVLLVAAPLSLALARRVSRPIEMLAKAAAAIREGDLDAALPKTGAREVLALSQAFREMTLELKQKASLEALVAEMQRRPHDVTSPAVRPGEAFVPASSGAGVGVLFAGRYQILSLLGEGGMGAVFRARDLELDEEVALKTLSPAAFELGGEALSALKHEIRIARRITHPNIVRAHDLGESGGERFLTMEYVPGTTLREVLDRRGALETGPGLQIAKQIFRGLTAVHEEGIIHGDVKPQNVMVMSNGVVKLMDFGISQVAGQARGSGDVTVGTPIYMSPEQARRLPPDPRSDLYSAGVVLYEMFTGKVPFRGEDVNQTIMMHVSVPAPDPRSIRPDLPAALAVTILACLAKTVDERPSKASDVSRTLMAIRA